MSYSNDLYGRDQEEHHTSYNGHHSDEDDTTSGFEVSSSLYLPLTARESAKLPSRPLSRLGTPRSLAQQ